MADVVIPQVTVDILYIDDWTAVGCITLLPYYATSPSSHNSLCHLLFLLGY